ncbi:MAG TPA: RodZ domain-containing protein [Terriglobales bacterium]|nr:RodZ domain-containing protein [Terriglobales bacterium]
MSSFGDKLRREREMRGVTLEEISESTKIGTRSLRALEQEDFEKLPGGIFNKGFVRAYSRFLGLDEDQTVADFDLAWNEHESAKGPAPEPLVDEKPEPERSTSKLLLAVLLVILALTAGWYALHNYRGARPATNQQPATSVNDSQRVSSVQAPLSSPQPVTPADRQSSNTVSNPATTKESSESPKPLSNSNSSETSGAPVRGSDKPANDLVTKPANSSAAIRLEIFAREDSWLSILADGKNMGQGILNAQKSRTIHAQKEVRLTVGNAGGVEVSFNGQAVDIGGEPNQVKELIFTSEGLQR